MTNQILMRCSLSLLLALGAVALPAQTRPTILLDKGASEYPEPFSKVTQLVELRDGRLLLLDTGESALLLVDLKRGTSSKVSRKGGGPLEYQMPGSLLGGAPDTLLYLDMMQGRFLLLSQTAVPLGTARWDRGQGLEMFSMMVPTATDARGHVFGQTLGLVKPDSAAKAAMPVLSDTVELRRFDRSSGKTTTLTRIRNPAAQSKPKVDMSGGTLKMSMTASSYHPSDVWTALPDGRVAILRNGAYQVEFVNDVGKVTSGPVIPYIPIQVTAAEKRALVDSLRVTMDKSLAESQKAMASMRTPDGKGMPKMEIEVLEPKTWAATKPAYTAILSGPDGGLWVKRSQAAGSKTAGYDLLNGNGALLAHIQLAAGESLVGIGRGAVYTIRMDEDDLQYLRRYTLPVMK